MTTAEPTSDEKLMAAFSYWGSLVLWFLPPLIIFMMKKDESTFIKKHALQCLLFHVAAIVVWIGLTIVVTILGMVPGVGFLFSLLAMPIYAVIGIGYWIYLAFLGYKVFQGEDTDIPYITEMMKSHI